MNYFLELTLALISVVFVLFTALIDSQAAVMVAGVAVLCYLAYKVFFAKMVEESVMSESRQRSYSVRSKSKAGKKTKR